MTGICWNIILLGISSTLWLGVALQNSYQNEGNQPAPLARHEVLWAFGLSGQSQRCTGQGGCA